MRITRVCSALLLLAVICTPLLSREADDDTAPQDAKGALLYRIHCQNCHGKSGVGDGPMAKLLKVQPSNLTVLARENGGDFSTHEVRQAIDGRSDVRAHGTREMPVWGLTLQQPGRDNAQEDEIQARINDLVAYLASIQIQE